MRASPRLRTNRIDCGVINLAPVIWGTKNSLQTTQFAYSCPQIAATKSGRILRDGTTVGIEFFVPNE
ncbi:hypothetical protein RBSH_00439 [Rhodopirellula baltica SH28]|uniref:Uncharacterized protein n=1 Tax=Rhodopirellula baltica SH28 TaxID=993517 RepID=K5DN20_RHOBT|nr:hypothetical protein RBSH_00439 [Rhodopirellula baltica SH28]